MNLTLTPEQEAIADQVAKICARFGDDYWSNADDQARFPEEFYRAMADAGFLGICMPTELGGAGLGVTEAAIMMHTVAKGGGGYAAASSIHLNIFGPHAIVKHGTEAQKRRFLPPLVAGAEKAFPAPEPNAGLDTTSIETFARAAPGGYLLKGRKIWTTTAQEADRMLILAR